MSTSNKEDCEKKLRTKREKWRHAFAIGAEYEEKLTDEDEKMLDAFARAIAKRGMAPAAILSGYNGRSGRKLAHAQNY